MSNEQSYKAIGLMNGSKCEILICRGEHLSRAIQKQTKQSEFDVSIFLMVEMCVVDGSKREIEYFQGLLSDDYLLIIESIGDVLSKIR